MRDKLPKHPKRNEKLIMNLDSAANAGTHWVAILKDGNIAKYYDPIGNIQPPTEVQHYLSGCTLMYNIRRDQPINSELCGQYCLQFLLI